MSDFIDTQLCKIYDYSDNRQKKTKQKKIVEVEEEKKKEDMENEMWNIFSRGVKEYKTEFTIELDQYEKGAMK